MDHTITLTSEELSILYQTYDQVPIKGREQRRAVERIERKIEAVFAAAANEPLPDE